MDDIGQIKEQATAWEAVCKTLSEVYPGWHDNGVTGIAAASESIRILARHATLPDISRKVKLKPGTRVVINNNSGFSKGSKGTVEYQDPTGRIWVRRDGASNAAFFHRNEIDVLEENHANPCSEVDLFQVAPCSLGAVEKPT